MVILKHNELPRTYMLHYSNMPLDRGSNFRKDPSWLKAQMSAQSKWVLVKNNQTLFIKDTPKASHFRRCYQAWSLHYAHWLLLP